MIRKEVIPNESTRMLNLCLKDNENGICFLYDSKDDDEKITLYCKLKNFIDNNSIPITLRKLMLYEDFGYT